MAAVMASGPMTSTDSRKEKRPHRFRSELLWNVVAWIVMWNPFP
jgi:hypothetical protein